ncbi:tRNA(Ile)-lysidine synthase [Gammaproteobacteria bacterium]
MKADIKNSPRLAAGTKRWGIPKGEKRELFSLGERGDLFPVRSQTIKKIFIAYSGGLDSHVLLHLLVQLRRAQPKLQLTAIHINHNLSLNAKQWTKHCKKICKELCVECIVKNVNAKIKIKDHSPEEIARKLRYEAFVENLPKNAVLVTAHQANDQAETLLLQLFRGAGPKGLAAMPIKVKFGKGWLMRPLLSFSREELLQYAKEYKLKWIEDESNADIKFRRNLIRHKLMPIIRKNWPGITTTLNRVASLCAAANELLENLAAEDLVKVIGEARATINIEALKKLPPARQGNVLRFWLHTLHLPTPSEAKLNEVIRTMVNSRSDASPVVGWQGTEIRRFQNYLYAMSPLLLHDKKQVLRFDLKRPLKLPGNLGVLRAKVSKKFLADFKGKRFTVQFRQGGEKLKLSKRQGTHELKKLMQEWQIPPWLRDRIPLVYCGSEIIAVIGCYCTGDAQFQLF